MVVYPLSKISHSNLRLILKHKNKKKNLNEARRPSSQEPAEKDCDEEGRGQHIARPLENPACKNAQYKVESGKGNHSDKGQIDGGKIFIQNNSSWQPYYALSNEKERKDADSLKDCH